MMTTTTININTTKNNNKKGSKTPLLGGALEQMQRTAKVFQSKDDILPEVLAAAEQMERYEDKFIRIDDDGTLTIKKNTFFLRDETIELAKIELVELPQDYNLHWWNYARYGCGGPSLWGRVWWQHDWRMFMSKGVVLVKVEGRKWFHRNAFSVTDALSAQLVVALLQRKKQTLTEN